MAAAAGRQDTRRPIGLERLQSDADLPCSSGRSIRTCPAQRDIGVQLWGDIAGGIVHYVIGVLQRRARQHLQPTTRHQSRQGPGRDGCSSTRSAPRRLRDFGNLGHRHLGAGTGNRKGRLPTRPATVDACRPACRRSGRRGRTRFSSTSRPPTDTTGRADDVRPRTIDAASTLSSTTTTTRSACWPSTCWLKQGVQKGNTTSRSLTQQSAARHGQLHHQWADEGYDGATPDGPLRSARHGTWGALELAARYGLARDRRRDLPDLREPGRQRDRRAQKRSAGAADLGSAAQRSLRRQLRADALQGRGGDGAMGMTGRRSETG